jgi:hypothetical protein
MKIQAKGTKKILLYTVIGGVVILILANFVFAALGHRLKQFNKRIKLTEAKLTQILGIQKAKDTVEEESKTYNSFLNVEKWDERRVVEELLKETERIARDSRVSVINLSPQQLPEITQDCKKYKADLRIDATLEQIYNLLRGIEMSKLLIKVEKLTVASKNEEADILKSEMTIAIAIP